MGLFGSGNFNFWSGANMKRFALLVLAFLLASCAVNPVTGGREESGTRVAGITPLPDGAHKAY